MPKSDKIAYPPAHPGEFLREDVLTALDMSKSAFADHLGISRQTLYSVLNGEQRVGVDLACRLGRALGNGARFWLTLQMQYDIWQYDQKGCDVAPLPTSNTA